MPMTDDAAVKEYGSREKAREILEARLEKLKTERPDGYLIREAPQKDIAGLKILVGHLQPGLFLTKIRKTFTPGEMSDDLVIVPAEVAGVWDSSEYQEILPSSPP